MALFAISDLHLSQNPAINKPMDVFGCRWQGYTEKIEKNWKAVVKDGDTVVIPGDISWGMDLAEARDDFVFLESLPGNKIIGKGNHDLWWQSMKKLNEFVSANSFRSISFLFNNCYETEHYMLCGSRGWWADGEAEAIPEGADYDKIVAREAGRLRASLSAAETQNAGKEKLVFLHFPVSFAGKCAAPLLAVLREFSVSRCYFGHIHGVYDTPAHFEEDGVMFSVISADFLNFVPLLIDRDD